jgi:uncharacterized protein YjdB
LKAGDEVRVSADGAAAKIYLKNSGGSSADDFHSGNYHAYSFLVPSDGIYYLYVDFDATLDANGEFKTYRLRYDVGNQTYGSASIEGPDELTMKVGETVRPNLRITPYDADLGRTDSGLIFSFSSNNYSVAYGNSFGCILAKSVGDATISVSAYNSACTVEKKTILVHVVNEDTAATATPTTPTTQLSIQNPPDSLALGEKAALTAVQDAGASEAISWSSSDTGVLYVSSKGVVTAVGRGSAEITATSASGVKASVTIAVTAAPEVVTVKSVRLDQTSLTLYLGEGSAQLTATVLPADATNGKVTWTSYNTQAATVDQNGLVTPVGQGVATITASAGGYKASCTVTVQPQRVRVTGISFSETDHNLPLHSTVTLLPTVAPGNATVKTLTWVSDDPTVATVSRTGIVTGVSVGSTTVTATTVDGGYSAQITIHVTASAQLGDINMDGYIDSADAMMALKVAVGKITLTAEQTKAADVNHDGYVDAADAVKILRYDAGLIDALT